jgi:hypothetical protein
MKNLPETRSDDRAIIPTSVSTPVAEADGTDPRLLAMETRFLADFAAGRTGGHRNTFHQKARMPRRTEDGAGESGRRPA